MHNHHDKSTVLKIAAVLWTLPNTLIGLALATLALGRQGNIQIVDGVVEAHSPAINWLLMHATPLAKCASAITFGHVVLGCDAFCLDTTRSHERVHVRQYEIWGPLFLPAYLLASLLAALTGKNVYRDNWFERQAYELQDDGRE